MLCHHRFAWIAAGLVLAATARSSEPGAVPDRDALVLAERAHARCQRAMAEDRCVAAGSLPLASTASAAAPLSATVLVAGVGPVQGDIYRQLQQADARMCDLVRAACLRQPGGALCATALRLW